MPGRHVEGQLVLRGFQAVGGGHLGQSGVVGRGDGPHSWGGWPASGPRKRECSWSPRLIRLVLRLARVEALEAMERDTSGLNSLVALQTTPADVDQKVATALIAYVQQAALDAALALRDGRLDAAEAAACWLCEMRASTEILALQGSRALCDGGRAVGFRDESAERRRCAQCSAGTHHGRVGTKARRQGQGSSA